MTDIVFLIEDAPEGGYTARALGESIFTEADDIESLREEIRDAVRCHFPDEQTRPKLIRLFVRDDEIDHQTGSHMRLTTERNGEHHITIPNHNPIKVGTLSAILRDVAEHVSLSRDQLLAELFQK